MKKAILLLSFLAFMGCGNSTPDESNVKEAARAAIIQNLKNPDAKFHHNEVVTKISDSSYQYVETINATNGFGASIKQDVTVKVKWLKGDPSEVTNWSILDIQFFDR